MTRLSIAQLALACVGIFLVGFFGAQWAVAKATVVPVVELEPIVVHQAPARCQVADTLNATPTRFVVLVACTRAEP